VDALQVIRDETCNCSGDPQCIERARQMALKWHGDHRGAQSSSEQVERAKRLLKELIRCDQTVGLALSGM
jgi:hypothetical protein